MSLTQCINCNHRISDKSTTCEHCGFTGLSSDPERMEELRRRIYREKRYRLTMRSYIALTIFTIGMLWYWVESEGFTGPPAKGPLIVLAIGTIAYLVIRALMISLKMRYKR